MPATPTRTVIYACQAQWKDSSYRPNLDRLIVAAAEGTFDALMVAYPWMLGHSPEQRAVAQAQFALHGVEVHVRYPQPDEGTPHV